MSNWINKWYVCVYTSLYTKSGSNKKMWDLEFLTASVKILATKMASSIHVIERCIKLRILFSDRGMQHCRLRIHSYPILIMYLMLHIVACFPCAGTVEARSLESSTQQKENECL
jgi:hypothetical protein